MRQIHEAKTIGTSRRNRQIHSYSWRIQQLFFSNDISNKKKISADTIELNNPTSKLDTINIYRIPYSTTK